jgi:hypothetical protein
MMVMTTFTLSCTGSSSECPTGQVYYPGGISSEGRCGQPTATCRSWGVWIAPGWAGGSEPQLSFDRAVTPAVSSLKVGARMQAGFVSGRFEPSGCGADVRYQQWSMRSSDPSILRLESMGGAFTGRFLAVAPGTARILADGPPPPDGRAVELSICVDPSTRDDKNCTLMPVVIRVVP